MALWELLRAVRRHPFVVVAGMVATFLALLLVRGHPGLYEARTSVVLAPAGRDIQLNPYWGRDYSLIASAGVLTEVVNQDIGHARTSSSVSLSGKGVRDGYAVDLPNKGGQFVYDFDRPILEVQAVGETPEAVQANLRKALTAITNALTRLQDEAGVPVALRISTRAEPAEPAVLYGRGRPSRALLATMILGAGITLAAVLAADDRRGRRRRVAVPEQPVLVSA